MNIHAWPVVAALAVGLAGPAAAQSAQQVNPTDMPPGSQAGAAPGMGGARAPGQAVNPTDMSPGSQAGATPGMNPGPQPLPGQDRVVQGTGQIGGTGAQAPDAQPRVVPAQPGAGQAAAPATGTGTGTGTTAQGGDATSGGRVTVETGRATGGVAAEGGTLASGLEEGANSFTADQAADRMARAGFNDVQQLRLDERGIWLGRAIRDGQQTGVAMDFRGNVVAIR